MPTDLREQTRGLFVQVEQLQQPIDVAEIVHRAADADREVATLAAVDGHGVGRSGLSRGALTAAAAAVAVLLLVGGVAWLTRLGDQSPPAGEPPATTAAANPTTVAPKPTGEPWPPSVGSEEIPGPVAAYDGLVVDKLGLRVPLEPPEQTRAEFLAELDAEGWATYIDAAVGWSVRYPADWTLDAEPGRRLVLETPTPGFGLVITLALDARPGDASSYDYHVGYMERAVAAGELYPVLDEQTVDDYWIPVDLNFNGRFDPQDITDTDLYHAVDDEGNPIPEGHPLAWFLSWAYYDPAAEPAYGYLFADFGADRFGETGMYPAIDRIVLSFEPPLGS
jgi:hypothetical protein